MVVVKVNTLSGVWTLHDVKTSVWVAMGGDHFVHGIVLFRLCVWSQLLSLLLNSKRDNQLGSFCFASVL